MKRLIRRALCFIKYYAVILARGVLELLIGDEVHEERRRIRIRKDSRGL